MPISVAEEIRQLRSLFWSERDPEGRVFAPLADAYRRQGDLAQAAELLEEGVVRHVDFVPGHVVSGWVRRDRGEHEAATIAFRAALALDAENAEAVRALAELSALALARGSAVDAEPAASSLAPSLAADEAPGPVTRTMADLCARQGLHDRALQVYRLLLERDPHDASLRERVAELEAEAGEEASPNGAHRDLDVEKLARDWAEGPGDTGELSTPFAWTPPLKSRPPRSGPAAREYFRELLAWEPRTPSEPEPVTEPVPEPVATLPMVELPVAEPVAEPVAALPVLETPVLEPPGVVVAIASLAPEQVVPIASLAHVVGIASLAPDAVPIASLAPDSVPIRSLAPDFVPIASLAPDQGEPSSWPSRLR